MPFFCSLCRTKRRRVSAGPLDPSGDSPDTRYPFSPAIYLPPQESQYRVHGRGGPEQQRLAREFDGCRGTGTSQASRFPRILFSVRGSPSTGRTSDRRGSPGANQVVVISYDLWQRRFWRATDRSSVESSFMESLLVLGVLPRDFRFFTKTDVWTPRAFTATEANDRNNNLSGVVARRKPGALVCSGQHRY